MSKYQEALNKIVKSSCPNCIDNNGCFSCDIQKICNCHAKSWVDTLQELIDRNAKLEKGINLLKELFTLDHEEEFDEHVLYTTFPEYISIGKINYEILKEVLEDE